MSLEVVSVSARFMASNTSRYSSTLARKSAFRSLSVSCKIRVELGSGEVVMLPGGLEPLKHPNNFALLGDDDGVQVAKVYHGLSQYVVLDLYGMAVF